jgi:hypothetical protein
MNYTKKVILIPEELTQQHKPVDKMLSALDVEMEKLLFNSEIPSDKKMKLYNQVLQQHAALMKHKHKPYQIEIQEEIPSIYTKERILEDIPPKIVKTAEIFLQYLQSNPNIEISDQGELILYGHAIKGSNIIDIVHDFSRQRKTQTPVLGAKELIKVLKRSNIPKEIIGNKLRWVE